jgi:prolipoprotein diacylglyceryl transferase
VTAVLVLASIPSPSSASISIGPVEIRAYGLMIALGVIAAVWMLGRRFEQKGLGDSDDASSIAVWGVIAGVIGSRLYHVATEWPRFEDDLGSIPRLWEGGLGIPGGLIAGVAAGLWQAKRRGIAPMAALTCVAPALPLAQAIGRLGNWFNQELYGRPTDLPWALEIDDAHNGDYPSGTTFHPTFLYESLWNLGLCGVLLWIDRRFRLGPGRLFACYLIGYGAGRFWIEALRIDPTEASDVAGMRFNQWVALAAVAAGVIWLVVTRGQKWPEPVGEPTVDDASDARASEDASVDTSSRDHDGVAAVAVDAQTAAVEGAGEDASVDATSSRDHDDVDAQPAAVDDAGGVRAVDEQRAAVDEDGVSEPS